MYEFVKVMEQYERKHVDCTFGYIRHVIYDEARHSLGVYR